MYILWKLVGASCLILLFFLLDYGYKTFARYRRFKLLTRNIPEKRCIPIIGQILRFLNFSRIVENAHNDFLKFYTPTKAFLGPELFIQVSDPVYVQIILNSSASIEKPRQYEYSNDFLCNGLISASFQRWKKTRKLLNPAFHQKLLEGFMHIFSEQGLILVKKLEQEVDKQYFDVCDYVSEVIPNIVFLSITGREITLVNSRDNMYKLLQKYIIALLKRALNPLLHNYLIYKFSTTKKEYDSAGQKLDNYIRQILNLKRRELKWNTDEIYNTVKNTLLEKLLDISKDSGLYTEEQLRGELLTMFFAATDSTIMSICFTLVLLGMHKDIQLNVVNELIQILGSSDAAVTYDKVQRMSFLERVIKEVMRLYPPVPFIGRRLTEDLKIGKYTLPKDSVCVIGIYSLHRNSKYWSNPDLFNPDRFLPHETEKRHPYAYLPFSGGPRNCIGKGFAKLLIKTTIATLLKNYEIDCNYKLQDIKLEIEVVAKIIGGFKICLKKRINQD